MDYGSISSTHLFIKPTILKSLVFIFTNSRTNWLLIFIPLGHLAKCLKWNDASVFILNFLALVPFAKLFEFVVERINFQVDKTFGSLLYAVFGNAVELIIFITTLKDGKIHVIQSLILGSIILNLLLVSGACFIKEITHKIQKFRELSLMTLVCSSLGIPAAFSFAVERIDDGQLLTLPHVMATITLIFTILYRYFQVKTRLDLCHLEKRPQLSFVASLFLLAILIVIAAFSVEYLINSIENSGLSRAFICRILLPIICDTQLITAICKIFSAGCNFMQIIIFVIALVILGWQEIKLYFQPLNIIYISCFAAGYLIQKYKLQKFRRIILCPESLPY